MPYDYFCISQRHLIRQKRHYISSPMKLFRIISLIAVAAMLLAGCRSHKANVSSPHGQWGNGYHDYSSEVTDAMGADLAEEARGWLGTPIATGEPTAVEQTAPDWSWSFTARCVPPNCHAQRSSRNPIALKWLETKPVSAT